MLEELKQKVYEANMDLPRYGLVTFTWGNVSAIDREKGLFVIKPSGVEYDRLQPEDMVVMDLEGNKILIEGEQKRMKQDLADQYVRMRKDMKLTQEQVSRRSGIPRSNIARFESGRYNPSLELMVKMAAAMGLKVQIQLVPDKDAKK